MEEDGFSTLSVSFPCRWQPLELGIVNLKTHSLRNKTGRGGGGGREKGEGYQCAYSFKLNSLQSDADTL